VPPEVFDATAGQSHVSDSFSILNIRPVLLAFSSEFTIEVGPELLQHISRRIKTELYAKL
jgi:hypothetical protein